MTTRRISFLIVAIPAMCLAACLLASQGWAATPEATPSLLPDNDPVEFPSVGRVLFGFVLTAALAVAAVYAMRRWLPKFGAHLPLAANLRIIGRASIHSGLRLHVVEVEGQTVLVAEGKSGIAMTVLKDSRPQQQQKEAQPVL